MKDNFSAHAQQYAQFRPDYPDALIKLIADLMHGRENAWDCATGNGQMALKLAHYVENIYATDISQNQLSNATSISNIHYKQEAAEAASFPDDFFDLVIVAQAIHWFDFSKFYQQVMRTLRNDGIFAAIGYGLISINPFLDAILRSFYKNIVGPYWDPERSYIDDAYQTIPFPFDEIQSPVFHHKLCWDIQQLEGYLNTWSATQHYIKATGTNPVSELMPLVRLAWNKSAQDITFPIFCRIGKKHLIPAHSLA